MAAPTTRRDVWRKSSYSSGDVNCVEVAVRSAVVWVRDSKQPQSGHIEVKAATFRSFVNQIKAS
jgi:hypothetical protein